VNRFEGKAVLLTGAASGIGRATALRLTSEGAAVFAVDLDGGGLHDTVAAAEGPGSIQAHVADVSDESAVVDTVRRAVGELGGVDALVNVAGIHRTTPIDRLTVGDLHRLFEVNAVGPALFCRETLPHLPENGGVIVNVTSTAAGHGNPYMTAYSASKGALHAFSLSLASEVVHRGIRVVTVAPGTVTTPLTAGVTLEGVDPRYFARIYSLMGPAEPEQIAGALCFAASEDASYLTGVELRVDGGSHI
jgi:NAD(P)-dependent dehydrogenase (short-subunit alcohol dehydrogenase family)